MPVVYVDVVWLVNVVLDAVILWVTCWVLKSPTRIWRVVSGALAGACYALLLFAPSLTIFTTWPGKAIASLAIVAIGIPCRTWLQLARACLTYYLVAFVFAGAAIAMHFAIPGSSVAAGTVVRGRGLEFSTSLESLALLVAMPCGAGLLKFVHSHMQQRGLQSQILYTVHSEVAGRHISFVGLADTGNQLRDPLSRKPVCMVDASVMRSILPLPLGKAMDAGDDIIAALDQCWDDPFAEKLSIIPFRGAGGRQQLALAVRPDRIEIEHEGRRVPVLVPCLLAVHQDPLSVEGRFQAILHIDVLTGVDGRENNAMDKKVEYEAPHPAAVTMDSHSD